MPSKGYLLNNVTDLTACSFITPPCSTELQSHVPIPDAIPQYPISIHGHSLSPFSTANDWPSLVVALTSRQTSPCFPSQVRKHITLHLPGIDLSHP
jgi:hypothetical protein